ncbi:MAG TPA: SPFH domain-containing protein [Chroococcidiopsis sp.]
MADKSVPLIQTLTPERWAGLSMDFIDAGYIGLLVKNGQLIRKLEPGRHFSFALPILEKAQLILVDNKIRNLDVVSQGDFLSSDQFLVNVSLTVMYQVVDPKRVALELSNPIGSLISAIKDNLGVVINQMSLHELTQQGRVQIREYILSHLDSFYLLGFNLDDVRVSDINFPQTRGVARQVEGLTARQEAIHEAAVRQAAALENAPAIQQINIGGLGGASGAVPGMPGGAGRGAIASPNGSGSLNLPLNPPANLPVEATVVVPSAAALPPNRMTAPNLNPKPNPNPAPLPPTTLAVDVRGQAARLIHRASKAVIPLSTSPFTIGREPHHTLVSADPLCSRNHARIDQIRDTQGNTAYQITDIGSSNGTFINNQRLPANQAIALKPGFLLKIGADEWVFER